MKMKHIIKQAWYSVYIIEDTTKVTEKIDIPQKIYKKYIKATKKFIKMQYKLEMLYNISNVKDWY